MLRYVFFIYYWLIETSVQVDYKKRVHCISSVGKSEEGASKKNKQVTLDSRSESRIENITLKKKSICSYAVNICCTLGQDHENVFKSVKMENKIKHSGELDFTLSLILTNIVHSTMNRESHLFFMDG